MNDYRYPTLDQKEKVKNRDTQTVENFSSSQVRNLLQKIEVKEL